MKRQFIKLFTVLLLLSILLYVSFSELIRIGDNDSGRYHVAVDRLLKAHPEQVAIETIAAADLGLPSSIAAELADGKTLRLRMSSGDFYYVRQIKEGELVRLGPVKEEIQDDTWFIILVIAFYVSLIGVVLALVWPVFRDLDRLQQQAVKFGSEPQELPNVVGKKSTIAPLANTFNRMSRQVVRLVSVHKTLSQVISHEVRTPLARMRFALSLMKAQSNSPYTAQMERDLDEIENLATSYLTFARLDYLRKRKFNKVDVRQFIGEIEQDFAIYSETIHFSFNSQGDFIWGDPQALKVICQNLISNALRFAKQNVSLTIGVVNKQCLIQIEDDGKGLPNGSDPFSKFEQAEQQPAGFGLGLFIVQQLAKWHSAEISTGQSSELGGALIKVAWQEFNADSLPQQIK